MSIKEFFKKSISIFRLVFKEFSADNILKYSASLAYYTVFSIAPLLVVVTTSFGIIFGKEAIEGQIYGQLNTLVGSRAAIQIQEMIKNVHLAGNNFFATVISIAILIIGATSIFGEIQDSINKIWGLRVKSHQAWWRVLITRLVSFSLIFTIGFIMIVSVVLNAIVAAFGNFIGKYIFNYSVYFIQVTNEILSFLVASFLFSLLFKILPDARVKWKDVLFGGFITAIFFTIGKLGIGFYLGKSNITSLYGAAGSIIILMIWVYYSSIILYLGAEFTKVYAKLYGEKILPKEYAEWVQVEEKPVADEQLKNRDLH
jgi:membrane protein